MKKKNILFSRYADTYIEALKKYKELKDQGIITEEEFDAKKSQLLK